MRKHFGKYNRLLKPLMKMTTACPNLLRTAITFHTAVLHSRHAFSWQTRAQTKANASMKRLYQIWLRGISGDLNASETAALLCV